MTEIDWATIRDRAIEQFDGQTPRAADEERIIDHFEHQPTVVIQAITEMAKADKVTWKWSALAARLDRAGGSERNPVVQTGPTRTQAIAAADNWLRHAGLHLDRWDEVHDELFGDRGYLHEWRAQKALVDRYQSAWETIRPIGQLLDDEELERAERWVTKHANMPKRRITVEPGLPWKRTPVLQAASKEPIEPEPPDYDYGNPAEEHE
jgi:hypothetical protein